MILAKNLCLFAIGGCAYVVIELLFRGYSHYTMFLLAGVCFLAIGHLGKRFPRLSPALHALISAAICTQLHHLGLSGAARQLRRADLPPVHPAVDPPKLLRRAGIPPVRPSAGAYPAPDAQGAPLRSVLLIFQLLYPLAVAHRHQRQPRHAQAEHGQEHKCKGRRRACQIVIIAVAADDPDQSCHGGRCGADQQIGFLSQMPFFRQEMPRYPLMMNSAAHSPPMLAQS